MALATCADYFFAHAAVGCEDPDATCDDTVQNVNVFKKFTGIAVQLAQDGGPLEGVTVTILRDDEEMEQGVTDEDGYFSFLYKHKGKAAEYEIVLSAPDGSVISSATVTLKGNGWATAMYNSDWDADAEAYVGTWDLDWK